MAQAVKMATFHNPTSKPIAYRVGRMPGLPPDEYVIGPGEEFQGPLNYEPFYTRKGFATGGAPAKQAARAKQQKSMDELAGVPPQDDRK